MKRLLFLVLAVAVLFGGASMVWSAGGKTIALLPFYDDSGYQGPWELYREVPEMLGDMLYDEYFTVVPMDTVLAHMPKEPEPGFFSKILSVFRNKHYKAKILSDLEAMTIAKSMNADYAVTGIIEDFSFRRTGGGSVLVGGYKSYTSKVGLSNVRVVRVIDGTPLGTVAGEAEQNDRGWGLELLGKPRDMDLEFYRLDSLDFGSKGFLSSQMGVTTIEALNKVQQEIRAVVTVPDTGYYAEKQFKIISVDGGIVNIDAGPADGVSPGDQFRVFTAESNVLVGRINVTQNWAEHISRAEIIQGRDAIRAGDIIMPE